MLFYSLCVVTMIIGYFQNKVNIICEIFRTPNLKRKEFFMIYRNIKAIADEKGISIRKIELDTGITPSSIYHWDKIKPSVDKVAKVADYLGVPIEKLLY